MANKHSVEDNGDLRKYFTAIPNLVFKLGLNPYELALYAHFKQTAGDDGGVCWKSRATIAKQSGMSSGMVTKARRALQVSRPELGGRSLITLKEEASKTGGKTTCRVLITDIWALNMSKFSTSLEDIATSHHGVETAPSPQDQSRHTMTLSTSPPDHKEKPIKKNPEEKTELCAHVRLMRFLSLKIGPIPNASKEGKAVKWLLENGYDPSQCEACFDFLAAEDWRTAAVTWVTVKSNIGAWLTRRNRNGSNQPRRESSPERNARNLRENIEYIHGLSQGGGEADREDPVGLLASGF